MSGPTQDTAITEITDVTRPVVLPARSDCLVVIYDESQVHLRKRVDLLESVVRIGRDEAADLMLQGEGISRKHARVERTEHGCVLMDESRNGTLINDQLVEAPYVLRSGDRIKIGRIILRYLSGNDVEREFQDLIFQLTEFDTLTQLRSLRHFEDKLGVEVNRARRHRRPLSLLYLDLDHFKQVNDRYGHAFGDDVLKEVAQVLLARARETDVAARLGGEEMAILLPETTLEDAATIAEGLRLAISELAIPALEGEVRPTVSIGCAQFDGVEKGSDFRNRADTKQYEAKHGGRNRVCW